MFSKLFKRKNNTPSPTKRMISIDGFSSFKKKSAVVLIGVSCIGKTTFAKNFIETRRNFELISYDLCYRESLKQKSYASSYGVAPSADQIFREEILKQKNTNIIIDKLLLSPEDRCELFELLHELKYTIYVIYFTQEYTQKYIQERMLSRAVEMVLMSRMSAKEYRAFLDLDLNVLEVYAETYHETVPEVIEQFKNDSDVRKELQYHINSYNEELQIYDIANQEKNNSFFVGSDYYYEITA